MALRGYRRLAGPCCLFLVAAACGGAKHYEMTGPVLSINATGWKFS